MTNFEKIKAMTIEQIAEFLVENIDCGVCNCKNSIEEWLEQEVDDDEL